MEPMDEDLPGGVGGGGGHGHVKFGVIHSNNHELVKAGIAAGNIFQQAGDAEVLELPEVRPYHMLAGAGLAGGGRRTRRLLPCA